MFGTTPAFSGFAVDDLDIAEKFYGDTLGLATKRDDMGTLELTFAGGMTVFVYPARSSACGVHDAQLPGGRHRRRG